MCVRGVVNGGERDRRGEGRELREEKGSEWEGYHPSHLNEKGRMDG